MKYRKYFILQILLCLSILSSFPISAIDISSTYQFLDEWRLVIVDEKGINVTMNSRYVFSIIILNSTDGIVEAEMIVQDHARCFQWNLYQSHVGDYLIDSSRFSYFYSHWLETHPNTSENPNIDVLESSAVDFRFLYYINHRNVKINFVGEVDIIYTIVGSKSTYEEFIYDEEGVLSFRKQHMIFKNDSQLLLEEYYRLQRIQKDVETAETKFSTLSLALSIFPIILVIIRKKYKNE